MFDFPNAPVNGQTLTGPGGIQYRWDSAKWVSVPGGITSAAMATWFATLPTTPPPASGQPWNNGGTLSFTF